jgi:hypothetical protein
MEDEGTNEHMAYLDALAAKIRETWKGKPGMTYEVVLGLKRDEKGHLPDKKLNGIKDRQKRFDSIGDGKRCEMRYFDFNWPIEILIVGDKHMIVGFPYAGHTGLRLGISISDEQFVRQAREWYDKHIWGDAKLLDKAAITQLLNEANVIATAGSQ